MARSMKGLCKSLWLLMAILFSVAATLRPEKRLADNGSQGNITFVFHQPKYAPGDTAYFASYFFSNSGELMEAKQIVSIKILKADMMPILHQRVVFENGFASGQFVLPGSLAPGIYLIVCHP